MNETLSPPSTAGTAAATMADTVEIRDDDRFFCSRARFARWAEGRKSYQIGRAHV